MICFSVLHLDEACKVLSLDVVVCFQVDLSQLAGSHRVVFGVELVEAMKCLPPLREAFVSRVNLTD